MPKPQRKKHRLVTITANLLIGSMLSLASAQDHPAEPPVEDTPSLGVDVDLTYVSHYIWRGYDVFDDHPSLQPSINLDLFGTGFSANVWGAIPLGTGSNNQSGGINIWQEWDYTLAYEYTFFPDDPYAVSVGTNYIYYDFPHQSSHADTQEIGMSLSLPNLISIGEIGIIPTYYVGKLWPTKSGLSDDIAGGYHTFGLSSDLPIPQTDLALSLSAELAYNDGMFGADHDFSHVTLGISTSYDLKCPFSEEEKTLATLTPFLNYQCALDDMDGTFDDVLYGGLSVAFSF
jgi:hypothetical protein